MRHLLAAFALAVVAGGAVAVADPINKPASLALKNQARQSGFINSLNCGSGATCSQTGLEGTIACNAGTMTCSSCSAGQTLTCSGDGGMRCAAPPPATAATLPSDGGNFTVATPDGSVVLEVRPDGSVDLPPNTNVPDGGGVTFWPDTRTLVGPRGGFQVQRFDAGPLLTVDPPPNDGGPQCVKVWIGQVGAVMVCDGGTTSVTNEEDGGGTIVTFHPWSGVQITGSPTGKPPAWDGGLGGWGGTLGYDQTRNVLSLATDSGWYDILTRAEDAGTGLVLANGGPTTNYPGTTCSTGNAIQTLDPSGVANACITPVTGVSASSPLASSGGATPNITCQEASGAQAGCLSAANWSTFDAKAATGYCDGGFPYLMTASGATCLPPSTNTAYTLHAGGGGGAVPTWRQIDLASGDDSPPVGNFDVYGVLKVKNGGTGSEFPGDPGAVWFSNGTIRVSTDAPAASGLQVLATDGGGNAPGWIATPGLNQTVGPCASGGAITYCDGGYCYCGAVDAGVVTGMGTFPAFVNISTEEVALSYGYAFKSSTSASMGISITATGVGSNNVKLVFRETGGGSNLCSLTVACGVSAGDVSRTSCTSGTIITAGANYSFYWDTTSAPECTTLPQLNATVTYEY